jgi:glycosyltransferase involved in cell wall biosynthesis
VNNSRKKILLVGPFPDDANMYPHLRAFISSLGQTCDVTYRHFPERGDSWHVWAGYLRNPSHKNFLRAVKHLLRLLKHGLMLFRERGRFDVVIAIDNFLYILCDRFFPHQAVILWSHDFISHDQPRKGYFLQPSTAKLTANALARRGRVIIQDADRLALLLASIPLQDAATVSSVFYLPVSLPRVSAERRKPSQRPVLMQLGGISQAMGSIGLLEQYQEKCGLFDLYFHGFVAEEFVLHLNDAEYFPTVSSVPIHAGKLFRIVAKADIGFVFYDGNNDLNYFNIRNASGQLVEFLRQGKPLVAGGCNSLRALMEEYHIGVFIDDVAAVSDAVKTIMERYGQYADACVQLFADHYDIARYMTELSEWLEGGNAVS